MNKQFRLTGASRRQIAARHTSLVNAVLLWLKVRRWPAHKMNSGATRTDRGGFIRYGFPGCPDVIGILPGGRFLGVECKTGTGRLTPDQDRFRRTVEELGGVYVVVRELEDLVHAIEERGAITCCARRTP